MKRRTILGTVLTVSVAGCFSSTRHEDDGDNHAHRISDQYECGDADRPQPDTEAGIEQKFEGGDNGPVAYESAGSAEYPSPPETTNDEDFKTFVRKHEEAYRQNQLVETFEERLTSFTAFPNKIQIIEHRDHMAIIRIDLMTADQGYTEDGMSWQGGEEVAAVYAIDETGAVRVEADSRATLGEDESVIENTPNPLERGNIIACFDRQTL